MNAPFPKSLYFRQRSQSWLTLGVLWRYLLDEAPSHPFTHFQLKSRTDVKILVTGQVDLYQDKHVWDAFEQLITMWSAWTIICELRSLILHKFWVSALFKDLLSIICIRNQQQQHLTAPVPVTEYWMWGLPEGSSEQLAGMPGEERASMPSLWCVCDFPPPVHI